MNNNNSVEVACNVQTSVDAKHKLICDFEVTTEPNELGYLSLMALRAKEILEAETLSMLADKGFYLVDCLRACAGNNIRPYVSKQIRANRTGDKEFYADKFSYDKQKDVYICPAGEELKYARTRTTKKDGLVGYDYRNFKACQVCKEKARCSSSEKGRSIYRSKDQVFLDQIDLKSKEDYAIYKKRQMIVEHPFGTIKRWWDGGYFLTRGIISVSTETALAYTDYNFKQAVNILGVEEMVKRSQEREKPVLV